SVFGFNDDGGLRYFELRIGDAHRHDLVFQDETKTIIKIGSQYASKRQRDNREVFGVPRWSFIENTSLWIQFSDEIDVSFSLEEESIPGHGRLPLPPLEHFSNRLVNRTLKINKYSEGLLT